VSVDPHRSAPSMSTLLSGIPTAQGLYDPRNEKDACGVAFVATLTGEPSHEIITHALTALRNMEHRGASGAEVDSGDGAGILTQLPDAFLRAEAPFDLPEPGAYAAGIAFIPDNEQIQEQVFAVVAELAEAEGLDVLGWREVPINPALLGQTARSVMPRFRQLFVAGRDGERGIELDRLTFALRKRAEHGAEVYFSSLSSRTIVYKGMLTTGQLEPFFPDLSDRSYASAIGLVHSRFSTNTFPSWPLAHPYRFIAHNGEINTVKGNRNWMTARESRLVTDLIPANNKGEGLSRIFPICTPEHYDTASFDEVLELLHLGGRSLPHAVLMMIPEAWENHTTMDPARRAFYQFHSNLMEPWDGPACVTFSDGTQIGAVLDRNGLRPARYWITQDGLVVLASEVGVLDIPQDQVIRKGRLQPGRMFLVDTAEGRIVEDDEIKSALAAEHPYQEWLHAGSITLDALPEREHIAHTHASVTRRQQTFGYTEEELRVILAPMARSGGEPLGSMGTDSPIAALSEKPRLLFDYFTQLFAQVTNPPLDAIREELITSLSSNLGPEGNLLQAEAASCRSVTIPFPVIDNDELAKLVHINEDGDLPGLKAVTLSGLYKVSGGGAALAARLREIAAEADAAIADGARIIVLSDRHSDAEHAPVPSLLLTAAVHHHLIRTKQRTHVGLIVEAGDVREVHHVALLVGYGAGAVNPHPEHLHLRHRAGEGHPQPDLRPGQGRAQGHVEDGHLHRRLLPGRAGVRGDRPLAGAGRQLLHRHHHQARRHQPGPDRPGDRRPPRPGLPGLRHLPGPPPAGDRRRVPVAPRGRAAPLRSGHRLPAAALHPHPPVRHLQAVHRPGERAVRAADDAARVVPVQHRGAQPDLHRRGRVGR